MNPELSSAVMREWKIFPLLHRSRLAMGTRTYIGKTIQGGPSESLDIVRHIRTHHPVDE